MVPPVNARSTKYTIFLIFTNPFLQQQEKAGMKNIQKINNFSCVYKN